jgi:hypothetical protein
VTREEIEQGFVDAGWELDGSFSGYLIVGEDEHLSIIAHRWMWGTDDPVFELSDGERSHLLGSGDTDASASRGAARRARRAA